MQFPDFDLHFTATSQTQVTDLQEAVLLYLQSSDRLPNHLNQLLLDNPRMPMALCLQGYLLKLAAHPAMQTGLDDLVARAEEVRSYANAREVQHISALQAWNLGNVDQALKILEQLTTQYPQDMIALRIAHYLHFYNGNGQAMAASTQKVLDSWSTDHPHYSYLLGMHAFGLEEQAQYKAAAQFAQQALAINRNDLWSIHAMSHVHYMLGTHDNGVQWLVQHANELTGTNSFRHHLHWHHALHYFAQDNYAAVLDHYDRELAASIEDDFYLDLCNNAALLWRLEQRGIDVGDRWSPLADVALQHLADRELVFASLHYLLPLVRHAPDEATRCLENLQAWAVEDSHQARVAAAVGLALATKMQQDALNSEITASKHTHSINKVHLIGGSKAQRELFA